MIGSGLITLMKVSSVKKAETPDDSMEHCWWWVPGPFYEDFLMSRNFWCPKITFSLCRSCNLLTSSCSVLFFFALFFFQSPESRARKSHSHESQVTCNSTDPHQGKTAPALISIEGSLGEFSPLRAELAYAYSEVDAGACWIPCGIAQGSQLHGFNRQPCCWMEKPGLPFGSPFVIHSVWRCKNWRFFEALNHSSLRHCLYIADTIWSLSYIISI